MDTLSGLGICSLKKGETKHFLHETRTLTKEPLTHSPDRGSRRVYGAARESGGMARHVAQQRPCLPLTFKGPRHCLLSVSMELAAEQNGLAFFRGRRSRVPPSLPPSDLSRHWFDIKPLFTLLFSQSLFAEWRSSTTLRTAIFPDATRLNPHSYEP